MTSYDDVIEAAWDMTTREMTVDALNNDIKRAGKRMSGAPGWQWAGRGRLKLDEMTRREKESCKNTNKDPIINVLLMWHKKTH